jgi:hypothetical protein
VTCGRIVTAAIGAEAAFAINAELREQDCRLEA